MAYVSESAKARNFLSFYKASPMLQELQRKNLFLSASNRAERKGVNISFFFFFYMMV